jgi:uncharacterized protein (UPF0305 family)
MSLEELSAMYDPETMDFDEFVQTYKNKFTPSVREEQDLAYEQSLAQDREKEKQKEREREKEKEKEREKEIVPSDDPKPTLAELRLLRLAKLAPEPTKPDYTTFTVVELKRICKERGLKGFTGKCKQDLINLLQ